MATHMATQSQSMHPARGTTQGSPENPPQFQEGFFYPEIIEHVADDQSLLARVVNFPGRSLSGLGSALIQVANLHRGDIESPDKTGVQRRKIQMGDHERVVLVTEPDPELADNPDSARRTVLLPGLTEMDAGSALKLHQAVAARHPERLTATFTTPGVSHFGRVLSIREALSRHPEETAAENLGMLRFITKGGPIDIVGTSLGSHTGMLMAAQNLAANPADQHEISHVKLISPAVGARNVPAHEDFRDTELSDDELIDNAASDFFRHMLVDPFVMLGRHPERTAECAAIFAIYALAPHKFANRAAAIVGNFTGAKQGVEWETVKDVARGTQLRVIGGERDPLMQATLDQWAEIAWHAPQTRVALVKGLGHAMTIAAMHSADYLASLEGAKAA